jgi:hypothetical protein
MRTTRRHARVEPGVSKPRGGLGSPGDGRRARSIVRTLTLTGVLAIGSLLAIAAFRPRPEVAGEGTPPPVLGVGAMVATTKSCSCGGACGSRAVGTSDHDTRYCCPLHPNVVRDVPGVCLICQMPLSRTRVGANPPGKCTCRNCPWARLGSWTAN